MVFTLIPGNDGLVGIAECQRISPSDEHFGECQRISPSDEQQLYYEDCNHYCVELTSNNYIVVDTTTNKLVTKFTNYDDTITFLAKGRDAINKQYNNCLTKD